MSEVAAAAQLVVTSKREITVDHLDRGKLDTLGTPVERSWLFTYHEIQPVDSAYLYRVTTSLFENHVSFLSSIRRNPSAKTVPQITFDDGHRSNYEKAFPILERFGAKATFFVLAGCVSCSSNYISWEQAREMALEGHRIASHGWSHRILTQCDSSELEREISGSKGEIEDRLGVEVDSISAPGGRWNERVVEACGRAGYKYLFHSNPWMPISFRKSIRLQGRQMVTGRMGSPLLQKLLQISPARRQYLRARYAAKERVRLILGDQLYHKLWCWLANWDPGEGVELQVDEPPKINRTARESKTS
jgi:peptidoglycan/xylan/chitin deacetylase (PgdA/CDA1 family)